MAILGLGQVLPVTAHGVKRTLRLMNHSRRDLLEICESLDDSALRGKPKGGSRTIENCLRHIASVEWWYVTRLEIGLPTDFPGDPFDLLQYTRRLAEREVKRLTKEQRTRMFQPHDDPSPVCNLWTARKVLRRFVDLLDLVRRHGPVADLAEQGLALHSGQLRPAHLVDNHGESACFGIRARLKGLVAIGALHRELWWRLP